MQIHANYSSFIGCARQEVVPSFLLDHSSFVAIECDSAADVFFLWMTIDD